MTRRKATKKKQTREQKSQALFMRRTYHVFKHMLERYKKTLPESPKRVRAAATLPFALADLRDYIKSRMGKPCRYCQEALTVKSFSADHRNPVGRGGSWRLKNVQAVCDSCNRAKGNLTSKEFARVYAVLATIDPVAKRQFLSRLKLGAMAMFRFRFMKK